MFRFFLTTSFIALTAPSFAETFTADARVDTVTIYPGLATVTRQVTLDLPAGLHDIVVPGLPQALQATGCACRHRMARVLVRLTLPIRLIWSR